MSLHGITTVARQEFRLRIRAGRWRWLLAAWFLVLLGFTVLVRLALREEGGGDYGPPMFGALMLFVLGLALLVVPSLTAQSVNGDRERGTLATLQVTRLTAAEIALGKLAAAWGTALVFLALSLPLVLWSFAEGGVGVPRLLVTLLVVAVLLGVVCAVAQALSAVVARSITSALLSYLTVFALTVGTLITFGLVTAITLEQRTVTERVPIYDSEPEFDENGEPGPPDRWENQTYTTDVARTDRTWWLLAPNPFVILADAAPKLPPRRDPRTGELRASPLDPLGGIGQGVRSLRLSPDQQLRAETPDLDGLPATWPWGLALNAALGAAAVSP
ncbi:MAG: ABC transporter permease [Actinomycetota bacterium]|nr:ABC transporter permease [Actinomycetota bacterium]